MKLAIIGSRTIEAVDIGTNLPPNVSEIVSGGAKGVDACAAEYAQKNQIPLTVFLPDYARYRKAAPLKRNTEIADYADEALVFWDGISRGTKHTIELFQNRNKPVQIILLTQ